MEKEADEFLTRAHIFYLATADDEGAAHVRPFGAHVFRNGHLYFMTSKYKDVYRQIKAHPDVEICGYSDGSWIRLSGRAEFCEDPETKKAFLAGSPKRVRTYFKMPKFVQKLMAKKVPGIRNMFNPDRDLMEDMAVFTLKDPKATIYSMHEEKREL